MSEFQCYVVTADGATNWQRIEAPSQRSAVAQLLEAGLTPLRVRAGGPSLLDRLNEPVRLSWGPSRAEQALVLTQLATMAGSGLPIDRAVDLLREQAPKKRVRNAMAQVLAQLRGGSSLSDAFGTSALLPSYAIGVVKAAEQSGQLNQALVALAERMTREATTRREIWTALAYPIAVLVATLLALSLVLLIIVPQFEPMFRGREAELPTLTIGVLAFSSAVRNNAIGLLAGLAVTAVLTYGLIRLTLEAAILRYRHMVPGLALRDQFLAAQFVGMLAMMTGHGVALVRAIPMAASALPSARWRHHLQKVEREVREGRAFSAALNGESLVPEAAIRLIEVGEKSGQLSGACGHASAIMGDSAKARIERLVALANPVAIISLGLIVALLVAGVMLGMFALGDLAI